MGVTGGFDDQVEPIRLQREDAARALLRDYIEALDEGAAGFLFVVLSRSYAYLDTEQRDRLTTEGIQALQDVAGADERLARLARLPD